MFVVIVYDVNPKSDQKVLKILRKYCYHIQKSVFDGELTPVQIKNLKNDLEKLHLNKDDSIIMYSTLSTQSIQKDNLHGISKETVILG